MRPKLLNVEDFRQAARRRLPKIVWAFVESAASDGVTFAESISGFRRWRLRQRSLRNAGDVCLTTTMAGADLTMPLALAPVGGTGAVHWTGDLASTRAAERCGTRMMLSTASSYSIEEVGNAAMHSHWFQLYIMQDMASAVDRIARARRAGFDALFVTIDSPVAGNREAERRWGAGFPAQPSMAALADLAHHPAWVFNAIRHRRTSSPEIARIRQAAAGKAAPKPVDWQDIRRIRDLWPGRLYIKGILDADDAAFAIDEIGAEGIVVSNHGGRQLDRALASVDALPAIARRIGRRGEIYLDGGIRRAEDIIVAICLGATGVFVGRPFLYGLAVAGEAGIVRVLDIFRDELKRCLALMGCASVRELDSSWLLPAHASAPQNGDTSEW